MRVDTVTRETSLAIASARLGRLGHLLLHDAGRGSGSAIEMLKLWSGAGWRFNHDLNSILEPTHDVGDARWDGNRLTVTGVLPETVIAAIVGRRLGDVIEGSGRDGHVIESAEQMPFHPEGWTMITVAAPLVRLGDLPASPLERATGPARRLAWWVIGTWTDTFWSHTGRTDAPIIDSVLHTAVAVMASMMLAFVLLMPWVPWIRAMPRSQWDFLLGAMTPIAALMVWATTGCALIAARTVGFLIRQRRGSADE